MENKLNITFEQLSPIQARAIVMLTLNREITINEFSDAVGLTRQHLARLKNKPLTDDQIKNIENYFSIKLFSEETPGLNSNSASIFPGKKEVRYWGENLPCAEKLKNPTITSLILDREIIYTHWHEKDEEQLNIIDMPGDKMDGDVHSYKNGDILVIDKTQMDISSSGVYFYTTNNHEEVFVSNLRRTPFGQVIFGFSNPKYEDYEVSAEEFDAANIEIIGRVIHNQSEVS